MRFKYGFKRFVKDSWGLWLLFFLFLAPATAVLIDSHSSARLATAFYFMFLGGLFFRTLFDIICKHVVFESLEEMESQFKENDTK